MSYNKYNKNENSLFYLHFRITSDIFIIIGVLNMKNYEKFINTKDQKLELILEFLEDYEKDIKYIEVVEFLQNLVNDIFKIKNNIENEFEVSDIDNEYFTDNTQLQIGYSKTLLEINNLINKYNLDNLVSCDACNYLISEKLNNIINNLSEYNSDDDIIENN